MVQVPSGMLTRSLAVPKGKPDGVLSVKEPFPYTAVSDLQPVPPQDYFDAQERIAQRRVEAVRAMCEAAGVHGQSHTLDGVHPWEAIIEHCKERGCDLIVMASHGRRGMSALLLGSETQKVLTHSNVPVLVVR